MSRNFCRQLYDISFPLYALWECQVISLQRPSSRHFAELVCLCWKLRGRVIIKLNQFCNKRLYEAKVISTQESLTLSSYSSRHGQIDLNEILDKMNEDPPNLEIGPPKDPKLLKSKILHVRNFWEILENRNFSEDPGLESGTFSLWD